MHVYIDIVTVVRRRSDEWGIVVDRINYRQDSLWESIPVATDDTALVTCLHNNIIVYYCNL